MAPDVKQDGAAVTLRDIRDARLGEPLPWQTPPDPTSTMIRWRLERDKIEALREQVRFWRIAYLTVSAQFLVVTIAAVWGWAR